MARNTGFRVNRNEYQFSDIEGWGIDRISEMISELLEAENQISSRLKDWRMDYQVNGKSAPFEEYRAAERALAQISSARQRISLIRNRKKGSRARVIGDYFMLAAYETLSKSKYEEILAAANFELEAEENANN